MASTQRYGLLQSQLFSGVICGNALAVHHEAHLSSEIHVDFTMDFTIMGITDINNHVCFMNTNGYFIRKPTDLPNQNWGDRIKTSCFFNHQQWCKKKLMAI